MKIADQMKWRKVWQVIPFKRRTDQRQIFLFLMEHFVRLFGERIMLNEPCRVYNDPTAPNPQISYSSGTEIRLTVADLSNWSETIFELSHEMCHYALRQGRSCNVPALSWFEEIVCEAMSLYCLAYAADHWRRCPLYKVNAGYAPMLRYWLKKDCNVPSNDYFSTCRSIRQLQNYESSGCPTSRRETHGVERNLVFQAMYCHPDEIPCVIRYADYRFWAAPIAIDFNRWLQDRPCPFLQTLKRVQPVLDVPVNGFFPGQRAVGAFMTPYRR